MIFCAGTDHDRLVTIKRQRNAGAAKDAEWCVRDDLSQVMALAGSEQYRGDAYNMFDIVHAFVNQMIAGDCVDHITV
jgi:hypothetical protein